MICPQARSGPSADEGAAGRWAGGLQRLGLVLGEQAGPGQEPVALRRRLLSTGDHAAVVDRWAGQQLPRSVAPGVTVLRDRPRAEVRVGLLRRRDAAVLIAHA